MVTTRIYEEKTNLHDMKFSTKFCLTTWREEPDWKREAYVGGHIGFYLNEYRWDEAVGFHLTWKNDNESYSYMKYEFIAIFL
jgi:hypothetical protein